MGGIYKIPEALYEICLGQQKEVVTSKLLRRRNAESDLHAAVLDILYEGGQSNEQGFPQPGPPLGGNIFETESFPPTYLVVTTAQILILHGFQDLRRSRAMTLTVILYLAVSCCILSRPTCQMRVNGERGKVCRASGAKSLVLSEAKR